MGRSFIGPQQIEKYLEGRLDPEQISTLPFSVDQLRDAKKAGEMLVLRVDRIKVKNDNGEDESLPLTLENMGARYKKAFVGPDRELAGEDFYIKETPRPGLGIRG